MRPKLKLVTSAGLRDEQHAHELNHKHYVKMTALHARIAARFAWAAFKAWCCK